MFEYQLKIKITSNYIISENHQFPGCVGNIYVVFCEDLLSGKKIQNVFAFFGDDFRHVYDFLALVSTQGGSF